MGITLVIRAIDDDQLSRLTKNPYDFHFFFYGPDEAVAVVGTKTSAVVPAGFLGKLKAKFKATQVEAKPMTTPRIYNILWPGERQSLSSQNGWEDPKAGDLLDMDRSNLGLHILLTGDDIDDPARVPLGCLNFGGIQVGEDSDSAWSLSSEQVRGLNKELEPITTDTLRQKYEEPEIRKLMEGYGLSGEESLSYLAGHFERFKVLTARAVGSGRALLFHLII